MIKCGLKWKDLYKLVVAQKINKLFSHIHVYENLLTQRTVSTHVGTVQKKYLQHRHLITRTDSKKNKE